MCWNDSPPRRDPDTLAATPFRGVSVPNRVRKPVAPKIPTHAPTNNRSWFYWLILITGLLAAPHSYAQTPPIRDITTRYEYDSYGNVTTVARSTGDGYID